MREASDPTSILNRRNVEPKISSPFAGVVQLQTPKKKSQIRQKLQSKIGDSFPGEMLTLKDRNFRCNYLSQYLEISTPDIRPVPGFDHPLSYFQRLQEGVDCDEVYPGVILGNGATLKRKDYLRKIGISHILNAAEHRGVNIDQHFFGGEFKYFGLRVEDTPQTQICR